MIGKTVSRYRIVEKLGEGGMGVVYKAEDTRLQRFVALKFLPAHIAGGADLQARFLQEARAASALDHPNIATIYDLERTEDSSFISMAYVDGQTLKQRLRSGPLDADTVIDIALSVAQGLAKAHRNGIVHRDIKSDNIMISWDGQVKITDFGLAKLMESSIRTQEGTMLGTPQYMSPEQAQGEEVDHRTDIFSLGIVLYEMVTGRLPFTGDKDLAVIYSVIHQDPTPVREVAPQVHPGLEKIINRALQKDPDDRYRSMEALLEDLFSLKGDYDWKRKLRLKSAEAVQSLRTHRLRVLTVSLVGFLILSLFLLVRFQYLGAPFGRSRVIAVLPFLDMTEEKSYEKYAWTFADALISDLRQSRFLSVVPQMRIRDILSGMGKDGASLDTIVAREVCRLSKTDLVAMGGLRQVDGRLSVQIDLYGTEDWNHILTVGSTGSGQEDFRDVLEDIGFQLREGLNIPESGGDQAASKTIELSTVSLEAYRCFLEGEQRIEDINMTEAERCFGEAVRFDSTFALAHGMLALIYNSQGQKEQAATVLEKAKIFIQGKSDKERLLIESYDCHVRRDMEGLLRVIEPLAQQCYDDIRVLTWAGNMYWDCGNAEKAISLFKRTLELDPERSYSYEALGVLYEGRKEWKKALKAYKRQVEIASHIANPYNSLGSFYLKRGEHVAAIQALNEAETLRPGFSCSLLGEAYFARGQYDLAETYFQQALHLSRHAYYRVASHIGLALIHRARDEYDLALSELQQAHGIGRDRTLLLDIEGLIYAAMGELDSVEARAEEIRHFDPQCPLSHHLIGLIHCQRGDIRNGLAFLNQALERLSEGGDMWLMVHLDLAEAYLQAGEPEQASEHCREIIAVWPGHAHAHFVLGRALEEQGKIEQAVKAFQRVLDIWQEATENLPELREAREKIARFQKDRVS